MQQSLIKLPSNNETQQGYILIELAIVMIVLSFMIATMFPIYKTYQQRHAIAETKERMEIVSKAFSTYAQIRWRLPCPADSSVLSGNQLGVERASCGGVGNEADAHGVIPYRTLGIPEQYAKDGYGNFFTYVVSPNYTVDNRLGVQLDEVNLRLAHLVGGDDNTGNYALLPRAQFCAPLDNDGTDITVIQDGEPLFEGDPRDITPTDRDTGPDANLLNRQSPVTAVALALISHGENGTGSYQVDGNPSPASAAGTAEEMTSNNTNRIVQMESDFSNDGANQYDDIVNFYTQDEIYAAAGRNSCEHL